jgi:hypothetical protein
MNFLYHILSFAHKTCAKIITYVEILSNEAGCPSHGTPCKVEKKTIISYNAMEYVEKWE